MKDSKLAAYSYSLGTHRLITLTTWYFTEGRRGTRADKILKPKETL